MLSTLRLPRLPRPKSYIIVALPQLFRPLLLLSTNNTKNQNHTDNRNNVHHGLSPRLSQTFKIHFTTTNNLPNSTPTPSALFQDLNFSPIRNSTAFTTDSNQSPWPSHSQSARHLATQNTQLNQQLSDTPSHQDFVLFPSHSQQATPHAQNTLNQPIRSASGLTNRRHSSYLASSLQNPRVAAISHAQGKGNSSPALNLNRYNPNVAQNQFYASPVQSLSSALNQHRTRPPVPLFTQSTGSIPHRNTQTAGAMAQGSCTFLEFDIQAYITCNKSRRNVMPSHKRVRVELFQSPTWPFTANMNHLPVV